MVLLPLPSLQVLQINEHAVGPLVVELLKRLQLFLVFLLLLTHGLLDLVIVLLLSREELTHGVRGLTLGLQLDADVVSVRAELFLLSFDAGVLELLGRRYLGFYLSQFVFNIHLLQLQATLRSKSLPWLE